jgi:transposase-like protein
MSVNEIQFACPRCASQARVSQVQGDRCPGCGYEFKWFRGGEGQTAQDYYAILTGEKFLLELPEGQGWIVAHY